MLLTQQEMFHFHSEQKFKLNLPEWKQKESFPKSVSQPHGVPVNHRNNAMVQQRLHLRLFMVFSDGTGGIDKPTIDISIWYLYIHL